ncbi:heme-binding protein [Streptomyces sp. NPDC002668]|uniref:heme-binding protein n=1 Tax=Streptomyces sp. NPDC002668 TaxID=3154422 RepID=UPI00331D8DC8
MSGHDWAGFLAADDIMRTAVPGISQLLSLPGSVPFVLTGRLVGALGVSGGHHSQDQAKAELAATEL